MDAIRGRRMSTQNGIAITMCPMRTAQRLSGIGMRARSAGRGRGAHAEDDGRHDERDEHDRGDGRAASEPAPRDGVGDEEAEPL